MKVLVNAASAHMGGAYTYLSNLLRELLSVSSDLELFVCVPKVTKGQLDQLDFNERVHLYTYPYKSTSGGQRIYFDQIVIPRLLHQYNIDCLFSSTGFGTFRSSVPQLLLIRNPLFFNQDYQEKLRELGRPVWKILLRRWWSLQSIRHATCTLFPTEAMRDMVGSYISLNNHGTAVLHYGFDSTTFFGGLDNATIPLSTTVKDWRNEEACIAVNVSSYAIHKNFEVVIDALGILKEHNLNLRFITTLDREKTTDKVEFDKLLERSAYLDVENLWVRAGHIGYKHISQLYELADFFLFPSFTESFGHPMVEAMAAGLPIIAADTLVNREVCQDAGIYFEKFDADDCASKIELMITDNLLRKQMRQSALGRAQHFSWVEYAHNLVGIWQKLITENKSSDLERDVRIE